MKIGTEGDIESFREVVNDWANDDADWVEGDSDFARRFRQSFMSKRGKKQDPIESGYILVPDWLITSHVTITTSSDWLFNWSCRLLLTIHICQVQKQPHQRTTGAGLEPSSVWI